MTLDRRKTLLFGAAALLRLLLFISLPLLSDLLTGRVELSTPVTSFKRRKASSLAISKHLLTLPGSYAVQEGVFLYTHNVSPYDGGVFHQVRS